MVTIAPNSDQNFKKYLNTKEPVDGYSIASIEWSERVGATKVTISKDGKFGTLTFNQALLSSLRPVARWLPVRLPQSVPLVASSGQGQAAYARVRAEIQRNPGAVGDPTPNFVPPQVTAPQQQLMMQRLLESGEKRSTTALIVVLYIATLVVWWDKSGYRDGPNRMKQKAATR